MKYLFLILIGALSFFSYTFVDLNLTLINWQPYLDLQKGLLDLGYFNRPLNGNIQLMLGIVLLICYPVLVNKKWKVTELRNLLTLTACLLTIGYTAYSHDLFNYIFDARIITYYGDNPYLQKALDYPQDDWIRFMQWTHRTYPYGPAWLLISIIPSILGLGKFLPTYLLFKLMFAGAYLLSLWCIYQIVLRHSQKEDQAVSAVALVAFHPLVLIDGILSPHLDMVMGVLGLLSIYLLFSQHKRMRYLSYLILFVSAGVKFATLAWLPFTNQLFIKKWSLKAYSVAIVFTSLVLTVLQAVSQSNYQPWYGLLPVLVLPLLVPYVKMKYLLVAGILLAVPMWIYVYHAYTGEWASAIPIF